MFTLFFIKSPAYLHTLPRADRERAKTLFIILNLLLIVCFTFYCLIFIFTPNDFIAYTSISILVVVAVLCLWLLHKGRPKLAANLATVVAILSVILPTFTDAATDWPLLSYSQIGLMLAALTLAALFGSKRWISFTGALFTLMLTLLTFYLSKQSTWPLLRREALEFFIDGLLSIVCTTIILYLLRRIYDRAIVAISTRNRRLERFIAMMRSSEEKYHRLSDASFEGVVLLHQGIIIEANRAFYQLFGPNLPETIELKDLIAENHSHQLDQILNLKPDDMIESVFQRSDGQPLTLELRSTANSTDHNQKYQSIIMRDITEERKNRALLEHQAYHDGLTGLPNRRKLQKAVNRIFQEGGSQSQCAILLVDLDRFREINDTLGHQFGDSLLQQISRRLQRYFQPPYMVSRTGGDEIALLIPKIKSTRDVDQTAKTLNAIITAGSHVEGITLEMQCSIGIAYAPEHGTDFDSLFRCADVAMYAAKRTGQGIAVYAADLDQHNPRRLQLLSDLSRMIRRRSFELYYQPKINLNNNLIEGYEVLSRWNHPKLGQISPGEIIPIAETGNQIGILTEAVLQTCLEQLQSWQRYDFYPNVAVNVSARNLNDDQFPDLVVNAMRNFNVKPNQLEFEITESAFMYDPERALQSVQKLHQAGIAMAIDDFGTGYSSLSYLTNLPIRSLKIDLTFVREMRRQEKYHSLVHSTIQLAHGLGLSVVAEGVEDEATALSLKEMQCDFGQGYYFGKPAPAFQIAR